MTLVRDRQGLLWESSREYRSGIDAFEADRDGRNGPTSVRRFAEWRLVTPAREPQYRHEWGDLFPAWPGEWASSAPGRMAAPAKSSKVQP